MMLSLRKRVADFVDNGLGFNTFALSFKIEKDAVTEGQEAERHQYPKKATL